VSPVPDCPSPQRLDRLPEWAPVAGPVAVAATFYFDRPANPINVDYPLGYEGDLDKLQRNLGDALQRSRVIADDRQITDWVARKRFTSAGQAPRRECHVRG
jgi:Holliday junction resolvase RusA-like endonuclease